MLCLLPVDRNGKLGAPILRPLGGWREMNAVQRFWSRLDHSDGPERAALQKSLNESEAADVQLVWQCCLSRV